MKKASVILSHLGNQPQFRYLKQQNCYRKYISLLGEKWQKAIAFVYIKNNTLFVAVTHPGFKMELNYNRDLLKSILTQLTSHDHECEMLKAREVVIFHSKYHPVDKSEDALTTVPYYNELASSDFKIQSKDKELKEKFEQIKEQIKCNQ
ncbi:DciA family protein [Sulfurovum sp.]|uniref:DciA family protein n=1 Tax=Sulfurovum sp. TaxID=1969726 RepID=UPI0025E4FFC4|nr:DciA family protein [Sulfurovum sp.]